MDAFSFDGTRPPTFETHTFGSAGRCSSVTAAAASADGRWLAIAETSAPIPDEPLVPKNLAFLCNGRTGAVEYALRTCGSSQPVQVAFVATTASIAILTDDSALTIITLPTVQVSTRLALHSPTASFALDRHSNYVVAVATSGVLSLYDLAVAQHTPSPDTFPVRRVLPKDMQPEAPNSDELPGNHVWPEVQRDTTEPPRSRLTSPSCKPKARGSSSHATLTLPGPSSAEFSRTELRKLLNVNGEYPHKYRLLIWEFLLQLPAAEAAFSALRSRGKHPSAEELVCQCVADLVFSPCEQPTVFVVRKYAIKCDWRIWCLKCIAWCDWM
jgi:hypothetical protein